MGRVVVIGATGHVGTYLVPRLVRAGHEVVAVSRGHRRPYLDAPEWAEVRQVAADRQAEDAAGTFGRRIAALDPDVVVDMVCFTADSARQLVEALRPARPLLVHCGTIWVHGAAHHVPVGEDDPREPFGEYGTGKAAIEALLHAETAAGGVPAIVLHPGHITGPGWPVITPAGNLDPGVWHALAIGEPLPLPDLGQGVLNHVHADDVAQAFQLALEHPEAAGASYHVTATRAMTLRGLAAGVAGWFGREPVLDLVDWPEFERRVGAEQAALTREHVGRGIAASVERAQRVLDYQPRYTSLEALREAVAWLAAHGQVDLGGQSLAEGAARGRGAGAGGRVSERPSVAGTTDPAGETPWAMQLVVRLDKTSPPSRTHACEAAAVAVVRLLTDERSRGEGPWAPFVRRWTDGRIRKHCRRARGAAWETASELPGVTARVDDAQVRAFVPGPVDAIPHEIAKLQLSGTELADPDARPVVDPMPGGPLVVSICPEPFLPLGKAAAAAGHAAQLALDRMPPERREVWARAGFPVEVEQPEPARWAALRAEAAVVVVDAGFTVVEPGTATALARWA